jgi:hypothetical protein
MIIEALLLLLWSSTLLALGLWGGGFASRQPVAPRPPSRRALRRAGVRSVKTVSASFVKSSPQGYFLLFSGDVSGKTTQCFADCGAHTSMITSSEVTRLGLKTKAASIILEGIGGAQTNCTATVDIPVRFAGRTRSCHAVVSDATPTHAPILLGLDWMVKHKASLDFGRRTMTFSGTRFSVNASQVETPELKATTTGTVPQQFLDRFRKLFAEPTQLPPKRECDMRLRLKNGKTPAPSAEIVVKDPAARAFMEEQRNDLLAKGFIELCPFPEVNACCAFVVTDKASDSRGDKKMRMVYDYRQLNAVLEPNHANLPRILDVVRRVSASTHFSKMDLRAGFHNLRMAEESVKLTVFSFPGLGTYQWKVMPFGLADAPGRMEQLMRIELAGLPIDQGVEVYLDDILIHASSQKEHDDLLQLVLERLESRGFHLKAAKCALGVDNVDFLGYRIGGGKFSPMQSNVQGILDFVFPSTVKAWQRFHGMINFYRLHIPRVSEVAKPITAVFNKKGGIEETPALRHAFDEIRRLISEKISLASFDPAKPVFLVTDASPVGWGAFVTQDRSLATPGNAWLAGTLSPAEQRWAQNQRELFAVISALRKYPELFAGRRVTVLTDNEVITSWRNMDISKDPTGRLSRWSEILASFDLVFEHIPASENIVTDALSRQTLEYGKAIQKEQGILDACEKRDPRLVAWHNARISRVEPTPPKSSTSGRNKRAPKKNLKVVGKSESTSSPAADPTSETAGSRQKKNQKCQLDNQCLEGQEDCRCPGEFASQEYVSRSSREKEMGERFGKAWNAWKRKGEYAALPPAPVRPSGLSDNCWKYVLYMHNEKLKKQK